MSEVPLYRLLVASSDPFWHEADRLNHEAHDLQVCGVPGNPGDVAGCTRHLRAPGH